VLLSLELEVTSCTGFFFWDNFTTNAVSPPAEVALATINPMLAKQNGHIASPLGRTAKRNRLTASVWMTGMEGRFLHQSQKGAEDQMPLITQRLRPDLKQASSKEAAILLKRKQKFSERRQSEELASGVS